MQRTDGWKPWVSPAKLWPCTGTCGLSRQAGPTEVQQIFFIRYVLIKTACYRLLVSHFNSFQFDGKDEWTQVDCLRRLGANQDWQLEWQHPCQGQNLSEACTKACSNIEAVGSSTTAMIRALEMATGTDGDLSDLHDDASFPMCWSGQGKDTEDCWRRVTTRHGNCLVSSQGKMRIT